MKRVTNKKRFVLAVPGLVILASLYLVGCGGGSNGGGSTIQPPASSAIVVVLSPSSTVVQVGATQQFNVTVSNATNTAVIWSVNGVAGGNATLGKISDAGLYMAPATVPNPAALTVTATSQQDSSRAGSAAITLVSLGSGVNNALLNGHYAFIFSGSQKSEGVFVAGGTFVADGNGNITDGREDGNFAGGIFTEQPFVGSYSIGADRRGTMIIANTSAASCGCSPTQFAFKFNVVSNKLADFIEFDSTGAGKGTIAKQDTAAFSLATLDGPYALLVDGLDFNNLTGSSSATDPINVSGILAADGVSALSTVQDIYDGSLHADVSASGSYAVQSTGRGTAAFPSMQTNFNVYLASDTYIFFIGMDPGQVRFGTALTER